MEHRRSASIGLLGAVAGLLILVGSVGAASTALIRIGETGGKYHFAPATTFVNVGGTVSWINGSDAPHTVTSDAGGELSSSTLNAGDTFRHSFAATGTFSYHCTIHTYMVGKVVVLAAGMTAPPTDTDSAEGTASPQTTASLSMVLLVGLTGGFLALRRFRHAR